MDKKDAERYKQSDTKNNHVFSSHHITSHRISPFLRIYFLTGREAVRRVRGQGQMGEAGASLQGNMNII
jgi:hypothetical protein